MENSLNERVTTEVYKPPVLVKVGEFNEDTLGTIAGMRTDRGTFYEEY